MLEYDIRQATTYIFKEGNFTKFINLCLILILAHLIGIGIGIFGFLLLPILYILTVGYLFLNTNIRANNIENIMPSINIINMLKAGFKSLVFLTSISALILILWTILGNKIGYVIFDTFTQYIEELFPDVIFIQGVASPSGMILLVCGSLIVAGVFAIPFLIIAGITYSIDLKIKTLINSDIINKTFKNIGLLIVYAGIILAIHIILTTLNCCMLISALSTDTNTIYMPILSVFIMFQLVYYLLVISDSNAQLIKIIYLNDKGETVERKE